jgi:CheY-like chemotaxis protein
MEPEMPSILVVDDTPVDRILVQGLLRRRADYTVEAVEDAESALERLETFVPDVLVTDLQLPQLSGLDLVVVLRERFPGLPVVVITAHGNEDTALQALADGAASYVPKPQMSERLLSTIDKVLDSARTDRAAADFQSCLQESRLRFTVPVAADVFGPLSEMAVGMAASIGLCEPHDKLRFLLALQAFLRIGQFVGNLELPLSALDALEASGPATQADGSNRLQDARFRHRSLGVEIELSGEQGVFRVTHQGPPLNLESLSVSASPSSAGAAACRELVLVRAFAHSFQLEGDGRTLAMTRRRSS